MHNYNTIKAFSALAKKTVNFLPAIFWILIIFGFDTPAIAVMTICSAAIHELGHICPMIYFTKSAKISSNFSGLRLRAKRELSYREDIIVTVSGPLTNIFLFFLCCLFGNHFNGYMFLFGLINLFTGISNLLPVAGYDGHRILFSLLSMFFSPDVVDISLRKISFIVSAIFTILSLYLMSKHNLGYFIFFIFAWHIFRAVMKSENVILRENKRKKEHS